ncbi:ABC transporter ATP-binding protein [Mesorhizobium sp. CU2]|uniref:ABC transporter ATP-binding protein n=1 Tax=unclassified Mesorhizobium TaxID=325217 RepID=UPI00112E5E71|nr:MULTISPECIES: ABC transporter ATP-binding protein [unclassified Mesorhizobium]TPN85638.1 ABC transporter ATP-binding protein [Mesorhizobium sp. CU3]TPO04719.1 ABC transporter ATP-binding protein [Mesorhizobium sp. CU2]
MADPAPIQGRRAAVRDLSVTLKGGREIVSDVGFEIAPGEILCLIGESGSGKTTVSTALLAHVRAGARIASGQISIGDVDVLSQTPRSLLSLRGKTVAYVAQDPTSAFNPAIRILDQMIEVALCHGWDRKTARTRAIEILAEVSLPTHDDFLCRFPHQVSGGQLQRLGIAIAMMLEPAVLVLDEPTTGLDVATQAIVLKLVRQLCTDHGIAALYVTHDLAVVAAIADRVAVMRNGRIVETDAAGPFFKAPSHDYSRELLQAAPDPALARPRTGMALGASAQPILRVAGLAARYGLAPVLNEVSFEVHAGECLAIVGESGSGKTTLSKCIVGQHTQQNGLVELDGVALHARSRNRSLKARRELQYIFQSPFSALNPRKTVGESIGMAHNLVAGSKKNRSQAVVEALTKVGLRADQATLRPDRLSGGERQRVCIARALICKPKVLVCDEITSALDVVVQEAILDLLVRLRDEEGLAMLFVTHNLAVVRNLADRVLVLDKGKTAEIGATEDVLTRPQHPYTQSLLANTLSISTISGQRWGSTS